MMNLFSSFNPISSNYMSMNWLMMMSPLLSMAALLWNTPNIPSSFNNLMNKIIVMQFKPLMNKPKISNISMINSIMLLILYYNLTSLLPNTFPPTSHIMTNLSFSTPMWVALMTNKFNPMKIIMAHLTPPDTPSPLIPFMVMVELLSLLIQPLTLAIRLTANVSAGHIMMTMISRMIALSLPTGLTLNMMMMAMELGMSLIQAYVMSMLIVMYMK